MYINLYKCFSYLFNRKQCCDFKASEKGRLLVESDRIFASDSSIYFSSIVGAAMRQGYIQV